MNRKEQLLTILSEECAELSKVASKAIRFGIYHTKEGKSLTNAERLIEEFNDIAGMMKMLSDAGVIPSFDRPDLIEKRIRRVEEGLKKSKELGTLQD